MINRRTVLRNSGCCLAAILAAPALAVGKDSVRPLAMTDITVRKELQADFVGTIRALRMIGYTHFGSRLRRYFPSEPEELPAKEKAKILADADMRIGAVRLTAGFGRNLEKNNALEAQLDDANTLGASVIVVPGASIFIKAAPTGYSFRTPQLSELDGYINDLNELGVKTAARGLKLAYHNHNFEAVEIEGKRGFDRMIDDSDPDHVFFEIDMAWAYLGGYDPLVLAARLGRRMVSVHLKDVDPSRGKDVLAQLVAPGDGIIGYDRILPRLAAMTTSLLAVEVDNNSHLDGLGIARRAYAFVEAHLQTPK